MIELVLEKMGVIRSFVNESRRKAILLEDSRNFNQIIACLDTIEDAEMAISEYRECPDFRFGNGYLYIYGLMQAFILQQDAVRFLADALVGYKVNISKLYPEIREIRKTRNTTIGHPTQNYHNIFTQIVRVELHKSRMVALFWNDKDECVREEIDIDKLIIDQNSVVTNELEKIIGLLEQDENKHINKWKGIKLKGFLPPNLEVYFTTEYDATNPRLFSKGEGIDELKKILDQLKSNLEARLGKLEYQPFPNYVFDKLDRLFLEYRSLLKNDGNGELEFKRTVDEIVKVLKDLRVYCVDLDEYYENKSINEQE